MNDAHFLRGERVPMTKEPVRALVLSRLQLHSAETFMDVGAGTGSVSLEAAVTWPGLQVIAIERDAAALALLHTNRSHFGCENVQVIAAQAPVNCDLQVDAIFIGGSGGQLAALLHWSLEHLVPGGRLVMTFILHENLMQALTLLGSLPVCALECVQLQASSMVALGEGHYFKPNNPTFVISCLKEGNHG
ncbi:decarboxylating cobalt-precorrin-6B (C(15))-methyltransferase [Mangrovibacter phragmitis]|uniref:decarboxylating cobalt-precorrin-6B (C(15))-methyltransferase n=1 Tax=Mangrovibacter phragmitis TaxID=1691903 RepID=UPI00336A9307